MSRASKELDEVTNLSLLEKHLLEKSESRPEAREALKNYLREIVGAEGQNLSIAGLLEIISKGHGTKKKDVACVLIRCLSVDGVVPDKSVEATISRSIVDICESALPVLCKFLRIDPGAQTFEKFKKIASAHVELAEILKPMTAPIVDLDSAFYAQKSILGALNHGVLSSYLQIYGLSEVKIIVDEIFSNLKKVSQFGSNLVEDVQRCRAVLLSASETSDEIKSFLSIEYLNPFMVCINFILDDLTLSMRDRFTTKIFQVNERILPKKYPLQEIDRSLKISIPYRNSGPGKAIGLRAGVACSTESIEVINSSIILGDVTPGQFSIIVDILVRNCVDEFSLILDIEWGEVGSAQIKSDIFEVVVTRQATGIDWSSLEYWSPYSTEPAQGDQFVGRLERIKHVAGKILRTPMEPFYITGQKRVGKTSLANASVDFAKKNGGGVEICSKYIIWGQIAYENPHTTLRELGKECEDEVRSKINIRDFPPIDCSESLAPLVKLFQAALALDPSKKFVLIIDEFDELHPELYLQGNLADTFFGNIRALTRCKNVCIALVGGENMPYVMDRQGQRLNNFSKISLSYYSRDREWADFKILITDPTSGTINWHEDAISEVFNLTSGNPYFSKIVCAAVVLRAVRERDADITAEEVKSVMAEEISSIGANFFAHLWQDGIAKAANDKEPEILARIRVLVGISRCLRERRAVTLENIVKFRGVSSLGESGVSAVLNDFVRRQVLTEESHLSTPHKSVPR
jgi:hypothetical protein